MLDDIYIFEIYDGESSDDKQNLMLYKSKDLLFTPMVKEFYRGWPTFPSFDSIVEFLNKHKIRKIATYYPDDLDTICAQEYEIGDFTDEELEHSSPGHRYYHLEFNPSDKQKEIFEKNDISIKYLSDKEKREFESMLKYHNTDI